MVKKIKTTNAFEHPTFNRPHSDKEPASILTQNTLLKRLAPSNPHSRFGDTISYIVKKFIRFFIPNTPSSFQSRLVRLIQKHDELETSDSVSSHYQKWLKTDKAFTKSTTFQNFEKHEQNLQQTSRISDDRERKKALTKLKDNLKKELNGLKEGESRLFALDRKLIQDTFHTNVFCTLSKSKGSWSLTLTGSGTVMEKLGGLHSDLNKTKVQQNIKFTGIPLDVLMNEHVIQSLIREASSIEEAAESLKDYRLKDSNLENLTNKTERSSKVFWNLVKGLSSSDVSQPFSDKLNLKQMKLRTHLVQLFELYQRNRYFLRSDSKAYQHLQIVLQNVSRDVLSSYKKGILSQDDMKVIQKELSIIQNHLLNAKKSNRKSFSSKVPDQKLLLLGVQKEDLKTTTLSPQSVDGKTLNLSKQTRAPAPLPSQKFISEKPISVYAASTIQTKDEAFKQLQALQDEWEKQPDNRRQIQEKVLQFFFEVPVNLFDKSKDKVIKSESFWWNFNDNEQNLLIDWIVKWTDTITADSNFKNNPRQSYYEALSNMQRLVYVFEAEKDPLYYHFRDDMYHALFDSKLAFTQISPFHERYTNTKHIDIYIYHNDSRTKDGFEYRKLPHSSNMVMYLERLSYYRQEGTPYARAGFPSSQLSNWIRPIKDPFLKSLLENARTDLYRLEEDKYKPGELESAATHEAFQTEPEGVFDYFLELASKEAESLKEVDLNALSTNQNISSPFTSEEKKRLLHLLQQEKPFSEVMAFMKQYPHLLRKPDVRNLIQAILFATNRGYNWDKDFSKYVKEYFPEKVTEESQRLEETFKANLDDTDLIRDRFETLAFLIECNIKINKDSVNAEMAQQLQRLFKICDEHSFLKPQKGYIAQLILENMLLSKQISVETTKESDLLQLFSYALFTEIPDYQNDPLLTHYLRRAWERILEETSDQAEILKIENISGLLDRLVLNKNLPLDASKWEHKGAFLYQNGSYTINLQSLSCKLSDQKEDLELIPQQIIDDANFKELFPDIEKKPFPAQIIREEKCICYRFMSNKGIPILIKKEGGQLFYFQQSNEGKWLQHISSNSLSSKSIKHILEKRKKNGRTQLGLAFDALNLSQKMTNLPYFLSRGIFVDPSEPLKGQVLDENGKSLFKIELKETWQGVEIEKIEDVRQGASSQYQLNLGGELSTSELKALSRIENPNNILLWSQKDNLKKVELPRYGLIFELVGKKLIIQEGPLKGYSLVLNPSINEKQFAAGMVLEHTDSKKPRKLILPDSKSLEEGSLEIKTKAKGLAKIVHFFQKIMQLIRMYKTGIIPSIVYDQNIQPSSAVVKLSYTTVDLRPFTNELVLSSHSPLDQLLEVAEQHGISQQPEEMLKTLDLIPLDKIKVDNAKLKLLTGFLNSSSIKIHQFGASTVKLKIALRLKSLLKKGQVEKKILGKLNPIILSLGKQALEEGPKQSEKIALTTLEKKELVKLAEKKNAEYLKTLVYPLVAEKGTEWDIQNEFPEQKQALHEAIKSIKDPRPERNMTVAIEQMEQVIHPLDRIDIQDLQYGFKKLSEDKMPYRLFKPEEVSDLFKEEEITLPTLNLKSDRYQLEECEKYSIEVLEKDLQDYRQAEHGRKIPVIIASSRKLENFLQKKISPKIIEQEKKIDDLRQQIEARIQSSTDSEEQLKILSSEKTIATFDEIKLAFAKGRLEELKKLNRLPDCLKIEDLKEDLVQYFECQVRRNALESAAKLMQETLSVTKDSDPEQWKIISKTIHQLLTLRCQYDAKEDPRFLIFEAQQFLQFKSLDAGLDQLQLLETLLSDPFAIVQAPTGSGKTAIFSVLRSLLKANGKNLVIQKVLPPLLQQTYEKYREVIGDLFGTSIYLLKFNLKMRLTESTFVKEMNKDKHQMEEVRKDSSIFKRMYHDLLTTMNEKGCVLTDYKSLPLLEERFWKLAQDLSEARANGEELKPIQVEHYTYLRKILILYQNKADENMDEFDQPNRPIHKIQVDLGVGSQPVSPTLIDNVLEIYDLLLSDEQLKLRKNVTSDFTEKMRQESIARAARQMANRLASNDANLQQKLYEYFTNQNEDALTLIDTFEAGLKDRITICKDQFTTFLPLTLRGKEGSRYARSDDGLRTLPCQNGEKHDAKPGTLLEQLNYSIQDYFQAGITQVDLKQWLNLIKKNSDDANDDARRTQLTNQLKALFPHLNLSDLKDLLNNSEEMNKLILSVNNDTQLIKHFLKYRLSEIKTSGAVVSMDPQQIIDMSAAVSGISATMGAAASLHPQFNVKHEMMGKIRAQMTYRVASRAKKEAPILKYNPEAPNEVLKNISTPVQAIIDGAGAFRSGQEGAHELLKSNSKLSQVGYHQTNEQILFDGTPTGNLEQTGFFFSQPYTRGTDIALPKDANVLLTLHEKDGLREIFQKEGRMRLPGQKHQIALSTYRETKNLDEVVIEATAQDGKLDAQDIFKATTQRLQAILRHAQKRALLGKENLNDFLDLFSQKERSDLFISPPQAAYQEPGKYFEQNKHLRKIDQKPEQALNDYKIKLIQIAKALGDEKAQKELENLTFDADLLRQMPTWVSKIVNSQELEMELQVEQEEDIEAEEELEVSLEKEVQFEQAHLKVPLGTYPMRKRNTIDHSVKERIYPAYSEKLHVSDMFLPLSRDHTNSLRKRKPFDHAMYRVGLVCVTCSAKNDISGVYLDDPLGLQDYPEKRGLLNKTGKYYDYSFFWDIRTGKIVGNGWLSYEPDNLKIIKEPEFLQLMCQVKFFDGITSGYTVEELIVLEEWLQKSDPKKMRDHLLNQVLQNRYQDKIDFVGSQLDQLFQKMMTA